MAVGTGRSNRKNHLFSMLLNVLGAVGATTLLKRQLTLWRVQWKTSKLERKVIELLLLALALYGPKLLLLLAAAPWNGLAQVTNGMRVVRDSNYFQQKFNETSLTAEYVTDELLVWHSSLSKLRDDVLQVSSAFTEVSDDVLQFSFSSSSACHGDETAPADTCQAREPWDPLYTSLLIYIPLALASMVSSNLPLNLLVMQFTILWMCFCLKLKQVDDTLSATIEPLDEFALNMLTSGGSSDGEEPIKRILLEHRLEKVHEYWSEATLGIAVRLPFLGCVNVSNSTVLSVLVAVMFTSAGQIMSVLLPQLNSKLWHQVKAFVMKVLGRQSKSDSSKSLFERVGGNAAVKSVIDILYEKIMADESIVSFFKYANVDKIKMKQLLFVHLAFGGPLKWSGNLRKTHMGLLVKNGLNQSHFDAVLGHLIGALNHLYVAPGEVAEVVAMLTPLRPLFLPASLAERMLYMVRMDVLIATFLTRLHKLRKFDILLDDHVGSPGLSEALSTHLLDILSGDYDAAELEPEFRPSLVRLVEFGIGQAEFSCALQALRESLTDQMVAESFAADVVNAIQPLQEHLPA